MLNLTIEQKELIIKSAICMSSVVIGCLIGAAIVMIGSYKRVKEMASELSEYKNKYGNL